MLLEAFLSAHKASGSQNQGGFIMPTIIAIIVVIVVIAIIVKVVKASNSNQESSQSTTQSASQQSEPTVFQGCAHPGWCQYTNCGKSAKAGYDDSYCYCNKKEEIVKRTAYCSDFLAPGCNNDICKYATQDHKNNTVYCALFQKTVAPQESCQYFVQDQNAMNMIGNLLKNMQDKQ